MAEDKVRNGIIRNLLGTCQNVMGEEIRKAPAPVCKTLPAGDRMLRIETLIRFVAGKNIKIRAVRPDSLFHESPEITPHIKGCLLRAQITLRSTCPASVRINAPVLLHTGPFIAVARGRLIIVPVLIMHPEEIPGFMQ